MSLYNSGAQEVPLERELQMLERYLLIQQLRFQDRLRVAIDVSPDAGEALVPNLLLQPLVENAIKHGLAPRSRGGRLDVRAERRNGSLVLRVADDGVGCDLGAAGAPPPGIGLENTRARLAHLYGTAHHFDVRSEPGRGFTVTVTIPFHTESPDGRLRM
jgi:two-component system, LytTR family, sensor kinase